jgi:hypothetical protein
VCPHVFAHLRPNHQTTALSLVPADGKVAKLPLPHTPNSHSTLSRLLLQDPSPPSPMPSLALSSIAAPTTASAFLQASLSKMPRSNFSLPQHPAPRHFRSRLTTSRTLPEIFSFPGILFNGRGTLLKQFANEREVRRQDQQRRRAPPGARRPGGPTATWTGLLPSRQADQSRLHQTDERTPHSFDLRVGPRVDFTRPTFAGAGHFRWWLFRPETPNSCPETPGHGRDSYR